MARLLKYTYARECVVEILSVSVFSPPPSFANERVNEGVLTSRKGANVAIQSMRDYDSEDEKQRDRAVQRRWVDGALGFRERLNDKSHN